MRNKYKKYRASLVTMATVNADQEDVNITVNRDELREAKEQYPGSGTYVLCHNVADNRSTRRRELRDDRYKATHKGKPDNRAIVNNRGNAGKKVYERIAWFNLRLGWLRAGNKL